MFSNFEKYFFGGHFLFFLWRLIPQKSCFWPFLTTFDCPRSKWKSSLSSRLRTAQFSFFKVEKSWKKYFWNTLILAPQDPILRPPMTSQDPKTINMYQKYILNEKYIVLSSFNKKTGQILNLTFWGATLGPPGGLQEAPRVIFCKNKTIILP